MRIFVRHEAKYLYQPPVKNVVYIMRLQPRGHEGQHIVNWRVEVDADCLLTQNEDNFGNISHIFSLAALSHWTLRVEGEVEAWDMAGVVKGTRERFPAELFLRATALTQLSPDMLDFSAPLAHARGAHLDLAHGLMGLVHGYFKDLSATCDFTRAAHVAFAAQAGAICDGAHVFIACARHLGLPARYVSGYLGPCAQQKDACLHEWAEVYIEGLGWVGFDPALNICPQEHHVRIAIGLDALSGAPMRSAVSLGSETQIDAQISIIQHQS